MAQVSLSIHGKPYGIACDEGQEQRVLELGRYVDSRLREIAAAGAASTESHLLVLTALVMSDEIFELRETIQNLSSQNQAAIHDVAIADKTISEEDEQEILAAIDHLASRIDTVADRLSKI